MLVSLRLDWGLGIIIGECDSPEGTIEHFMRWHFDQCPLLLRWWNVGPVRGDRPFRFQAMWCVHESYPTVVRNAWVCGNGNVKEASLTFNKETFGNICRCKRDLEARLKGI